MKFESGPPPWYLHGSGDSAILMCFFWQAAHILHNSFFIYFAETGRYNLPKFIFDVKISFRFTQRESNYVNCTHSRSAQKTQRTKICEKLVSPSLWSVHTSSLSTDCSYFLNCGWALTKLMPRPAGNSAVLYSIFKVTPIQQVSKLMWTLSLFFKICFPIIYGFPSPPPSRLQCWERSL